MSLLFSCSALWMMGDIRENLQNVDGVVKPNTVGRNVRARHGARDIVFGVVPRKMLTVTSDGSRERHIVHRALANVAVTGQDTTQVARSAVAMLRAAANDAVLPTPPPHVLPNRPIAAT